MVRLVVECCPRGVVVRGLFQGVPATGLRRSQSDVVVGSHWAAEPQIDTCECQSYGSRLSPRVGKRRRKKMVAARASEGGK